MNEHPERGSAGDQNTTGGDDLAARQRREQALRGLARQQLGGQPGAGTQGAPEQQRVVGPAARPSLAPPRGRVQTSRRRALLLVVAAVIVVACISGGIFAAVRHAHSTNTATVKHSTPMLRTQMVALDTQLGLTCTSRPAYSPDGQSIALLATVATLSPSAAGAQCPRYLAVDPTPVLPNGGTVTTPPLRIVILDARARRIVRQFPLAPFLASELNCPPARTCQPSDPRLDNFYDLSWSPDGQSLAVLYVDTDIEPLPMVNGEPPAGFGILTVLIVRADGSGAFRLTDPRVLALYTADSELRVWDVRARRLVSGPPPAIETPAANLRPFPFTLPFASSYRWSPDGQLQPQGTLPAVSAPQGAIGSPRGDATFSPWQPGYLVRVSGADGDSYVLRSAFWAWSSDSRYVATFGIVGGQVNVPGRIQTSASDATSEQITQLPPGGPAMAAAVKALAAAQQTVPSESTVGGETEYVPDPSAWGWADNLDSYASLAWSHDGTRLAALTCAPSTNPSGIIPDGTLTVYAVASGKVLGTATVPFTSQSGTGSCASDLGPIEWTPDDAAILVTNATHPVLTFVTAPH